MNILLLQDVPKLGHLGDVVTVKVGYARNYLFPQSLGTEPTDENIAAIAEARKVATSARAARLKEFESLAELMADVSVSIEANCNPEGTLYGSVGREEIAAALQEQGHPIKVENIVLAEPIRTLDNRNIELAFTDDIKGQIKLWVVRAGGTEDGDESGESDDQEDAGDSAEDA